MNTWVYLHCICIVNGAKCNIVVYYVYAGKIAKGSIVLYFSSTVNILCDTELAYKAVLLFSLLFYRSRRERYVHNAIVTCLVLFSHAALRPEVALKRRRKRRKHSSHIHVKLVDLR